MRLEWVYAMPAARPRIADCTLRHRSGIPTCANIPRCSALRRLPPLQYSCMHGFSAHARVDAWLRHLRGAPQQPAAVFASSY